MGVLGDFKMGKGIGIGAGWAGGEGEGAKEKEKKGKIFFHLISSSSPKCVNHFARLIIFFLDVFRLWYETY